MRSICLLVLLGLGIARAETPNDYAARWPLQTQGTGPAWRFEAGDELHAVVQDPEFGDLQVFNAAGEAVPLMRVAATATPATRWLSARFSSSGPAEGAAGDAGVMSYAYRLPALLAVDAARITLATAAARANVALQYRSGDAWITAARLTATGASAEAETAANEVRFPETISAQQWRLSSGMVLAPAPILQLAYRPAQFVFLAKGAGPYTLAAGQPVLRRGAQLDPALAQWRDRADAAGRLPLATLGARTMTPFVVAAAAAPDSSSWRPWLGGSALLVIAGIAAAFAWRRRRRAATS